MEFSVKKASASKERSGCVVVTMAEGQRLSPSAENVNKATRGLIKALAKRGDLTGKLGQSQLLPNVPGISADRVLVVGTGKAGALSVRGLRTLLAAAMRKLAETPAKDAVFYLCELNVKNCSNYWKARHTAAMADDVLYRFDKLKSKKPKRPTLKRISIGVSGAEENTEASNGLNHGKAIADGSAVMKDLANLPGNYCTPTDLAAAALALGKTNTKLKIKVLEEAAMEKLGMGALLSVTAGTRQPAKLIVMDYQGGDKGDAPIALVGKGVTFDSGGISIKPPAAMDEMKYDMSGAASVIGTMTAITSLNLPINVVGVVPATENLPDGEATKPGDIVTSMSGLTIEVLNTDAEGRLILCDALTYTEQFKPKAVVDIATLTGACVIALGSHASAVYSNHEPLSEALLQAGTASGDRAWPMPLWDDYQQQISSPFADIANIGGREAGSITAACFLSRFAKNFNWAHLDIAGTAWRGGKNKGSTGRPVALLTQYILDNCG
jgi:leucyl aminopeptidase